MPIFNPIYLFVKFTAYVAWCAVGIVFLNLAFRRRFGAALIFGSIRLFMGFGFGVAIFIAGGLMYSQLYGNLSESFAGVVTYLSVYVPVRWIEWSLLEVFMNKRSRSGLGFLLGADARSRLWRAGGIFISCLADIPLIMVAGGIPFGRFMC